MVEEMKEGEMTSIVLVEEEEDGCDDNNKNGRNQIPESPGPFSASATTDVDATTITNGGISNGEVGKAVDGAFLSKDSSSSDSDVVNNNNNNSGELNPVAGPGPGPTTHTAAGRPATDQTTSSSTMNPQTVATNATTTDAGTTGTGNGNGTGTGRNRFVKKAKNFTRIFLPRQKQEQNGQQRRRKSFTHEALTASSTSEPQGATSTPFLAAMHSSLSAIQTPRKSRSFDLPPSFFSSSGGNSAAAAASRDDEKFLSTTDLPSRSAAAAAISAKHDTGNSNRNTGNSNHDRNEGRGSFHSSSHNRTKPETGGGSSKKNNTKRRHSYRGSIAKLIKSPTTIIQPRRKNSSNSVDDNNQRNKDFRLSSGSDHKGPKVTVPPPSSPPPAVLSQSVSASSSIDQSNQPSSGLSLGSAASAGAAPAVLTTATPSTEQLPRDSLSLDRRQPVPIPSQPLPKGFGLENRAPSLNVSLDSLKRHRSSGGNSANSWTGNIMSGNGSSQSRSSDSATVAAHAAAEAASLGLARSSSGEYDSVTSLSDHPEKKGGDNDFLSPSLRRTRRRSTNFSNGTIIDNGRYDSSESGRDHLRASASRHAQSQSDPSKSSSSVVRLQFDRLKGKLFGREDQMNQLWSSFERTCSIRSGKLHSSDDENNISGVPGSPEPIESSHLLPNASIVISGRQGGNVDTTRTNTANIPSDDFHESMNTSAGYSSTVDSNPIEAVMIHGASGVGKSYMISIFESELEKLVKKKKRLENCQSGNRISSLESSDRSSERGISIRDDLPSHIKDVYFIKAAYSQPGGGAAAPDRLCPGGAASDVRTATAVSPCRAAFDSDSKSPITPATSVEPYSAFKCAMEQLSALLEKDPERELIQSRLLDQMGKQQVQSLIRTIPSLRSVLCDANTNNICEGVGQDDAEPGYADSPVLHDKNGSSRGKSSPGRNSINFNISLLGSFFVRFLRAIGRPSHPVILFLDDIQLADSESLDLISDLLTEKDCPHCMLITAFRENLASELDETRSGEVRISRRLSVESILRRKSMKANYDRKSSTSFSITDASRSSKSYSLGGATSTFAGSMRHSSPDSKVLNQANNSTKNTMGHNFDGDSDDEMAPPPPPNNWRRAISLGSYQPPQILKTAMANIRPFGGIDRTSIPEETEGERPQIKKSLSLIDDDSDDEGDDHCLPSIPPPIPFAQHFEKRAESTLPKVSSDSSVLPSMPLQSPPNCDEEDDDNLPSPPPTSLSRLSRTVSVPPARTEDEFGALPSLKDMSSRILRVKSFSPKVPLKSTSGKTLGMAESETRDDSWKGKTYLESTMTHGDDRPTLANLPMWNESSSTAVNGKVSSGFFSGRQLSSRRTVSSETSWGRSSQKKLSFLGRKIGPKHDSLLSDLTATSMSSRAEVFRSDPDLHGDILVSKFPNVVDMPLASLDVPAVNNILSTLINMDMDVCEALAVIVTRKTYGNPTSVMRFLEFLELDGFLQYSMSSYKWTWDNKIIDTSTTVTRDVGELLISRINDLSLDALEILKVASCIGYTFYLDILEDLSLNMPSFSDDVNEPNHREEVREKVRSVLEVACKKGLIEMFNTVTDLSGDFEQEITERQQYRFSHDLIQQNLYSTIPKSFLYELHIRIAHAMLQRLDNDPSCLFLCVNHFNTGSHTAVSEDDRIRIINLNLRASIAAQQVYSFRSALVFLEKSISLLVEQDWSDHYTLCLEVYASSAEVQYSCADLEKGMEYAMIVIRNAQYMEDRVRGYFVRVNILSTEQRFSLALDESYRILDQLGCPIPRNMKKIRVLKDLRKLKRKMRGMSSDEIFAMPSMTNEVKIACLRFLDAMTLMFGLKGDDEMVGLLQTKMALMTIEYGLSIYSPYSFASYGVLLTHVGEPDGGYRYGLLALQLAEKIRSKRALVRTAWLFYTFLNHLKAPLMDGIEPMLNSLRYGLQVGDIEYSAMCLVTYSNLYLAVGLPLRPFVDDMKQFCEQLELHNQHQPVGIILPAWQLALNLIGLSENPLVLNGDALDEQLFRARFLAADGEGGRDRSIAFHNYQIRSLQLAYIFQDLEKLELLSKKQRLGRKGVLSGSHFTNIYVVFFSGLAAFAVYRSTKKRRYMNKAREELGRMKAYCKTAGINAIPLYMLMLAELHTFKGDLDRTKRSFDEAISTLAKCGLIQIEAIACERAGDYMGKEQDDNFWSHTYYNRAQLRYMEWGATVKAEQLNDIHNLQNFQFGKDSHASTMVSIRGKQRYDPSTWQTIDKTDKRLHGSVILKSN